MRPLVAPRFGILAIWLGCILILDLNLVAAAPPKGDPNDWPHWRGPEQNGISRETELVDKFDPEAGEAGNLLWKSPELATISTPIVLNGKLYTLVRRDADSPTECEAVVCADAATGKVIWETRFNVYLSDVPGERVAWSNCVGDPETGNIYAQGVCGYFVCLNGETGKTIWSRSLHEEFGLLSTYGGRTNTPVVFEDLVLVSGVMTNWGELARPAHRFLGLDKQTGEVRWLAGTRLLPEDTTYSTPIVTVLNGQAAMVFGSGDGAVYALQPRTGKQIWKYQLSRRGLNVSPVVDVHKQIVFTGHSEENNDNNTMGAVLAIKADGSGDISSTGTLWLEKQVMVGKSSPVLWENRLYTVDDGAGVGIFEAATGAPVGRKMKLGTVMKGSLVFGDGKMYGCDANGRFHILNVTADGLKIASKTRFPAGEDVQGSPIISHGRIYMPTTGHMYCIGTKDHREVIWPQPIVPAETPVADDVKPAWVQIVPAEMLVQPGKPTKFRAQVFNSRGQLLPEFQTSAKIAWSVDAGGTVDAKGMFTASADASHTGVTLMVKLGELAGTARVRIVPALPWKFDFGGQDVPLSWNGARYRHQLRSMDGESVLVKVTTIPKGTRSQAWMGPIDLHDYTVQADVRGAISEGKLPDVGLIAQRYTLDLMGVHQQLQIRTWTATLRRAQTVKFAWEPDKWYTMKFQASVEKGNAVLRGKVWPKGQPEPAEWTVTATDETPNVTGSPGLFGNANDAELYYDNLTVTPNTSS